MDNSAKQYKILDPDNCAMCGMCLNHCPTYKVNNNESESPRGRISIIPFVFASFFGRGLRFFIVAAIFYYFGIERANKIKKYFEYIGYIATILLIFIFYVKYFK